MSRALTQLAVAISKSLQRQREQSVGGGGRVFARLHEVGDHLAKHFDPVEKALPPPEEKRREALRKFKNEEHLEPFEWRLVFAGLADRDEGNPPVLEDDQLFGRVHREVVERIEHRNLKRRDWLQLCFSYFAYADDKPDDNQNWCVLRDDIDRGFVVLTSNAAREKEWMRIVQHHRELFSSEAGTQLAKLMFEGKVHDLSALESIAQISKGCWLWRRIFAVLLSRIFLLDDEVFVQRLPELVKLGQLNELYIDDVLSACLTRYYNSRFREQSSPLLKQLALEHWGSPQMRSKKNTWLQYVEQPVCAMVVAWFAKEDLEHFFTLLKGETEVDQSRLFYWLRFANQMSYTRIVMGSDAWSYQSRDFIEFRAKNKGRLSRLTGGLSHNNAVVMQIGNYLFVEFSGSGNACYVYRADDAPFDPNKDILALATELKQPGRALKRMAHMPAPKRPSLVEGWLEKFDIELRELGIVPGKGKFSDSVEREAIEAQIAAELRHVEHRILDNRSKGGALQVTLSRNDAKARVALARLGFKEMHNRPLVFWRS
ncbi:type I Zorya anti-phage system protein ZorC [Pseudomonas delhiensis]|uniref:type I Zorya anti-phage system protein ZorC n=1 Tax=Pseudomonas delhiensis TaxID=366289 RepID=UPI00315A3522